MLTHPQLVPAVAHQAAVSVAGLYVVLPQLPGPQVEVGQANKLNGPHYNRKHREIRHLFQSRLYSGPAKKA